MLKRPMRDGKQIRRNSAQNGSAMANTGAALEQKVLETPACASAAISSLDAFKRDLLFLRIIENLIP